jgi:hypothetical protein
MHETLFGLREIARNAFRACFSLVGETAQSRPRSSASGCNFRWKRPIGLAISVAASARRTALARRLNRQWFNTKPHRRCRVNKSIGEDNRFGLATWLVGSCSRVEFRF